MWIKYSRIEKGRGGGPIWGNWTKKGTTQKICKPQRQPLLRKLKKSPDAIKGGKGDPAEEEGLSHNDQSQKGGVPGSGNNLLRGRRRRRRGNSRRALEVSRILEKLRGGVKEGNREGKDEEKG